MTLSKRDRRALAGLAAAVPLFLILRFATSEKSAPAVAGAFDSIGVSEKRLARVRQLAATVPGKEEVLKQVAAELAQREKGMIQAETAPQAQAQLLEVVRRVARSEAPPLEIKSQELGQVTRLSDDYGEVQVSLIFDCHIEDLVNFLADLTRQQELLATRDLRINATNLKEKRITVRLTVSGIVPKRLVPEKRGLASF